MTRCRLAGADVGNIVIAATSNTAGLARAREVDDESPIYVLIAFVYSAVASRRVASCAVAV